MIVNPGIRKFLKSKITSATFIVNNKVNTQVNRGTGPNTYTRASKAFVPDFEGRIVTVQDNSPSFPGLRAVSNLLLNSANLTAWSHNGSESVAATSITFTAPSTDGMYQAVVQSSGTLVRMSATAWTNSGVKNFRFSIGNTSSAMAAITTPQRFSALITVASNFPAILNSFDGAGTVNITDILLEVVQGATNQNPSEYIPTTTIPRTEWRDYANPNTVDGNGVVTDSGVRTPVYTSQGLLSEPAGTNTLSYSNEFSDASWVKAGLNTLTSGQLAPDGTLNAWIMSEDASTGPHYLYKQPVSNGDVATATWRVKAGTRNWCLLQLVNADGATNNTTAYFNTTTGAFGTLSNSPTVSAKPLANGFWEVTITKAGFGAGASVRTSLLASTGDGVFTYTGVSGNGVIIWESQLEATSYGSSLILSPVGTGTRAATIDSYPAAGNLPASGIRHISLVWIPKAITGTQYLWSSGTATDHTAILHNGTNIILRKRIASVNTDAIKALTPVAGTIYRIDGYIYANNTTNIGVNGVFGTADASVSAIQTAATMELGSLNGASQANANFGSFKILTT